MTRMNMEKSKKQSCEFPQELCSQVMENIIFCKILCICANSAKNSAIAELQNHGGVIMAAPMACWWFEARRGIRRKVFILGYSCIQGFPGRK